MLDIGLVQHVVLDLPATGWVEDLFLDDSVDLQFEAGLLRQGLLAVLAPGLLEAGENLLHLAVVGLQHGDGVHLFIALGHGGSPG
ncbi:hypothetical protein D3C81_1978960 [compost metagenome]